MALEKQLLLYDCRIGTNSGNIYLDDLNITDYNVQKGPAGIGYLAQASVLEN
jgi:ABC-type lipopolysaccharide export system ATPase subunit